MNQNAFTCASSPLYNVVLNEQLIFKKRQMNVRLTVITIVSKRSYRIFLASCRMLN